MPHLKSTISTTPYKLISFRNCLIEENQNAHLYPFVGCVNEAYQNFTKVEVMDDTDALSALNLNVTNSLIIKYFGVDSTCQSLSYISFVSIKQSKY